MKYTKKINDDTFITIEQKDFDNFAPHSLSEAFFMWLKITIGSIIGILLISGLGMLLEFIFE